MTSIKNDAFTIGTAAVAAAGTNVAYQNRAAIRKALNPVVDTVVKTAKATVKGDTYVKAGKAVKDAAKATIKKETYTKAGQAVKDAALKTGNKIKDAAKATVKKETYVNAGKAIKNTAKSAWDKVAAFGKATNWKAVGKYAAIAAGIAAVAVAVKEGIKAIVKD